MHSDRNISVRSPREEWRSNVIYLQASGSRSLPGKYEIEIKAGDQSSVSALSAWSR